MKGEGFSARAKFSKTLSLLVRKVLCQWCIILFDKPFCCISPFSPPSLCNDPYGAGTDFAQRLGSCSYGEPKCETRSSFSPLKINEIHLKKPSGSLAALELSFYITNVSTIDVNRISFGITSRISLTCEEKPDERQFETLGFPAKRPCQMDI